MKNDPDLIDELFKRVSEFSITYIELIKLKTVNSITEAVSALFPGFVVSILLAAFILFLNLGLAVWLGDMFGKLYYGFFIVAAFYLVLGFFSHFFIKGWFKKIAGNYFVKQLFR